MPNFELTVSDMKKMIKHLNDDPSTMCGYELDARKTFIKLCEEVAAKYDSEDPTLMR